MDLTPPQSTHRLLRAFVDELARCGMRIACTSPGSRNTPIVLSLAREPRLHSFSHIDERCAGFFAVGAAKASGRPVALTCTSGTAAAELMPAVVEAHWARVPLVVLTADRPAELRDLGAGQAIDQLGLYGRAVKWFAEVELPPADAAGVRFMRQLACRAYWTAAEGRPGPVHLNLPLREPLVLDGPLPEEREVPGRPDGRPWVRRRAITARGEPGADRPAPLPPRTVVVAGRVEHDAALESALAELVHRHELPVLADPLSALRAAPSAIATYDLLLRDPELGARLSPDCVLRAGDLPTSKPLRTWLAGLGTGVRQVVLDPEAAWQDPAGVSEEMWSGDPTAALRALGAPATEPPAPGWRRAWHELDAAALAGIEPELGDGLSEPRLARRLGEWLDPAGSLFVAASMPVRDLELFLPAGRPLPRVLAHRGANGIDGTVSGAFGVAAATGGPVTLLIGDVALLHDLGGLIAARRLGLDLTVVLIDNDGGGIFEFLAVSGEGEAYETHVATPHGTDFADVARLFGFTHRRVDEEAALRDALTRADGATLIEVRTDRTENRARHAAITRAGLAAARTAVGLGPG